MNKHLFALYVPELIHRVEKSDQHLIIKDKNFFHRVVHVLRLKKEDSIQLFDQQHHANTKLKKIEKKDTVIFAIESIEKNREIFPKITLLLPVLKKDALEQAVNSATQLGANTIQLIITQKMQRKWQGKRELDRLQKIIIASAEQAKNFSLPTIIEPLELEEVIATYKNTHRFFADANGQHLLEVIYTLDKEELSSLDILLAIGPEADLTSEEKKNLRQAGFTFVRLTSTILRAEQASSLVLGIFRALL